MPSANHKNQNTASTPAADSSDAQSDGTWHPDLDPDYSGQLRREQKAARQQRKVATPSDIWQPGEAVNPDPAQSVQIEEYHAAAQSPTEITQAGQPSGQGYTPPAIRQGTPAWVWLLATALLLISILLFREAGFYIFLVSAMLISKLIRVTNR